MADQAQMTASSLSWSAEGIAALRLCLHDGDDILDKGRLDPADLQPDQALNERLHDIIVSRQGNPWVERFVLQTHAILWHDYGGTAGRTTTTTALSKRSSGFRIITGVRRTRSVMKATAPQT